MRLTSIGLTVVFLTIAGAALGSEPLIWSEISSGATGPQTAFEAFKGKLGLQLYSLRFEFKKNGVGPTLDWAQKQGFRVLEGGGTYGLTREQFLAELKKRGMKMAGVSAEYVQLRDNADAAIE